MPLKFNPFDEYAIADYQQYKKFPFLESKSILRLKNKMASKIRDNFIFPERLLILGVPGIGKTSALFFIEDILKESKRCNVFFLSNFFTNFGEFEKQTKESFSKVTKKPTYILIDFPDTISSRIFKEFLEHLWSVITHENHEKISLIFSMNISHYNRSFNYSEIFGKFDKFRLEAMIEEEAKELIKSRLKMADSDNFFDEAVYKMIFKYSKGIPRNIICASKNLVEQFFNEDIIDEKNASSVMQEKYVEQVINDRIEDLNKRLLYKDVIRIIENDFNGEVLIQNELLNVLTKKIGIGKNKGQSIISDLTKFGIVSISKGGERNVNKIISLK